MISAARVTLLTIREAASYASVMSGGSRGEHCTHASALMTAPVSGCLMSWANEAANSPIMLTRLMWARSPSSWRSLRRSSSPFAILDVDRRSVPLQNCAIDVTQWHAPMQEPAIIPIDSLHSRFVLEWFASSQRGSPLFHVFSNVGGVKCCSPAIAQTLLRRYSR